MESQKNIFLVFILNLIFSIVELIGGTLTKSISILSDSLHDFSDSVGILISYILEKISKKKPNNVYSYGYVRYSTLGGLFSIILLIVGSISIIINAMKRIYNPIQIDYNGMILLAIIGVFINTFSVYFTSKGKSINQQAVNLHMFEDVLGWITVLIGSIVIKFTNINIIDPILSIILSLFILFHALKHLIKITNIFLMKTPKEIDLSKLVNDIKRLNGICDIHHLHIWSIDGIKNCATMHIVIDDYNVLIKNEIKKILKKYNIIESTIEFELNEEKCLESSCKIYKKI